MAKSIDSSLTAEGVWAQVSYRGKQHMVCTLADDHIGKWHQAGVFYELDLLEAVAVLNIGGHYLDVGAHVGNHSIFFKHHTAAQRVTAFEPCARTRRLLNANASRHRFEARMCAIHDRFGSVEVIDNVPGNSGMARVQRGSGAPARRIDDLGLTDISLIKIDTEGCEVPVLRSARQTIDRFRPVVVTEAANAEALRPIADFLAPRSYHQAGVFGRTPTYLWVPR